MRRATLLLCLAGLAGCAAEGGFQSRVGAVPPSVDDALAKNILEFVGQHARETDGPIAIDAQDTTLAPKIKAVLASYGYQISNGKAARHLRYAVAPLDGDVMLRIEFDHDDAAQLYRVVSGQLVPAGPLTVMASQ